MDFKKEHSTSIDFSEIVKKAYEKGRTEEGITISKLVEELKMDLRKMKV